MIQLHANKTSPIEVLLHVLTWSYLFFSPLIIETHNYQINWEHYLRGMDIMLMACITFYVNYLYLVPRYALANRLKWFLFINAIMLAIIIGLHEFLLSPQSGIFSFHHKMKAGHMRPFKHHKGDAGGAVKMQIFFIVRTFLTLVGASCAALALRLSLKWKESERARAEAELGRSQAELKQLKNQINPHFLLNTLNNIYALTAIDSEKAQTAIINLSHMLRYMLYENSTERVELKGEVHFINSYINLMKLRLDQSVDVQVQFDFPSDQSIPVAPLIFISLVENAFKHGVSPTRRSFIHIRMKANPDYLQFTCCNSVNLPSESDYSPGGIGLQQVALRLAHSYPERHHWVKGFSADGRTYTSRITIWNEGVHPPKELLDTNI